MVLVDRACFRKELSAGGPPLQSMPAEAPHHLPEKVFILRPYSDSRPVRYSMELPAKLATSAPIVAARDGCTLAPALLRHNMRVDTRPVHTRLTRDSFPEPVRTAARHERCALHAALQRS